MNPKGKKLMTVFAHPDDAEIWAGGTIAKWNECGGRSKVVCFTTDSVRKDEAIQGADILGSELSIVADKPEVSESTIALVSKEIEEFGPEVLITHMLQDSHPEHRAVFEIVSNSIVSSRIKLGIPKLLLGADTYNEICLDGVFNPNIYVDMSDYFDIKMTAIAVYKSQPFDMWKKVARDQNALLGSRLSDVKYAEGFIQVPILGKLANLSLF